MAQIFSEATDHLFSEFNRVRKNSLKLFKPLRIEDAVMQSNLFGSPPNWHLAHVTWFYQKVLEKHHKKLSDSKNVNLDYLNSYYQQFRKILPKGERGRYPRSMTCNIISIGSPSLMTTTILLLLEAHALFIVKNKCKLTGKWWPSVKESMN